MPKLQCILLLLVVTIWCISCNPPKIICRDPDVGGTRQNVDRRFLIIGNDENGGAGLGNLLIFFPAAFYFAALTGSDIVINDKSILGKVNLNFSFIMI